MNNIQIRLHEAAMRLCAETGSSNISVSDLAKEAGVVRGTVYNNVDDPDHIFERVTQQIVQVMNKRIEKRLENIEDPAEQLSIALRAPLQRIMDEPAWGKFLVKFALYDPELRNYWKGTPAIVMSRGIRSSRFDLEESEIEAFLSQAAGATFALMIVVSEGTKTWREAGKELAIWQLRALGISADEAKNIASKQLPDFR